MIDCRADDGHNHVGSRPVQLSFIGMSLIGIIESLKTDGMIFFYFWNEKGSGIRRAGTPPQPDNHQFSLQNSIRLFIKNSKRPYNYFLKHV